jgi:O-antigen/teichoic acid export membrane protein
MTITSNRATTPASKLFRLDHRSRRILVIAATSYAGRLGSALAVLVTIPLAKASLPPDLFGVWMMISGLVGFFAFADLGVGNGVLNRITIAHAAGDLKEQHRVMRAGYACTCAVAAVLLAAWFGWVALAPVATVVAGNIVPEHRSEVLWALHAFVVLLAVNIPASLIQKKQLGVQRGQWVGHTQLGAALGTLIGVPTALQLGGGLPGLVLGSLGMQVAANLLSSWLWYRKRSSIDPWLLPSGNYLPERQVVASLLRTGSLFLMLQLAAAFAFQSDAIVLVHVLGQTAYGDFAVVQRVFLAASSILLAGLAGLWPALGEALASGDAAWVKRTLFRSYAFVFSVMATTCLLLAFFMPKIVLFWVGMHTPPPAALIVVLALWTVTEALGNVSGVFLNAAGLLRAQIVLAVLMGTAAFLGKWILVGLLGAWGTVLATLIAYSVISIPMQIHLISRHLRKSESMHGQA